MNNRSGGINSAEGLMEKFYQTERDFDLLRGCGASICSLSITLGGRNSAMFDLANLLNQATEMFKGSDFPDVLGGDIGERLSHLSVDSETIDGAQLDDIRARLSEAGIDLSSVSETQLSEVMTTVADNVGDADLDIASLLDRLSN